MNRWERRDSKRRKKMKMSGRANRETQRRIVKTSVTHVVDGVDALGAGAETVTQENGYRDEDNPD